MAAAKRGPRSGSGPSSPGANDSTQSEVERRLEEVNARLERELVERKRVEAELRESRERFRQLAENLREVFWLSTPDKSQMLYVSPAYEEIFGRSCQSLLDDPLSFRELIVEEDRERVAEVLRAQREGKEVEATYRILRDDGQLRWLRLRAFPVHDENGKLYRVAGMVEDVTDRRAAEEELRMMRDELVHVARLSTLGEMSSALAHELNQPLTAITSYAEGCRNLVHAGRATPKALEEVLDKISAQASRAGQVVQRVRGFARKRETRRTALSVASVVRDVIALADAEAHVVGVTMEVDFPRDLPRVLADRVQLQQVLLNLVLNGIESMTDTVLDERTLMLSARVAAGDARDSVEVAVRDRGCGVAEEVREVLFQPFITTKPEGLGLGLSISRSIVEALGGELWLSPEPPPGSTFRFTLPLSSEGGNHHG